MKINLLLMSLLLVSSCSSEQWYAMGRHGGCFDLEQFSKTDPIITGAKTPNDIASKLKKAGIKYSLSKTKMDGMLSLDVPSKGWGITFVTKQYCQEIIENF